MTPRNAPFAEETVRKMEYAEQRRQRAAFDEGGDGELPNDKRKWSTGEPSSFLQHNASSLQ